MIIYYTAGYRIFFLLLLALQGCAPYKISTEQLIETREHVSMQEKIAAKHPLYHIIPRHRRQIKWYDAGHWLTWALFGNDDDGIFGEGEKAHYRPGQKPSVKKGICWFARNPLHNFCFYVIGSAHRENSCFTFIEISGRGVRCLSYSPVSKETFPDTKSCFAFVLNGGKPFVAARVDLGPLSTFDFYAGWRPRGNFGLKVKVKRVIPRV